MISPFLFEQQPHAVETDFVIGTIQPLPGVAILNIPTIEPECLRVKSGRRIECYEASLHSR